MANQTLKPFSGELDPVDSASGLKPFTGTLDGEKPQRTLAQAAKDTGAQLAEGVNTTLGAIPSVVAPQSRAAGFFRDNAQYWRDQQSDVLKDRIAASDQRIQEAGKDGVLSQIGTAASEYWNDPAQAARLVATNLPSMAATLGTGAAAGLAAKGVAAARGLDAANKAALAAKYGTTTAAATNAALNAGGARGEAFEDLQKAAIAQGMTPEQAEQAGVSGSILPGVVGGVAGAISGKIGLEKAILGQATTGAAMRKAAGAFGAELAGEQIEELAPKVATNYQVGRIDPGRTLTDDLGRTMVETAIGSGPGAVVAGGASAMRTGETLPPPGAGEPTTSPGAADPNAPQRPPVTPPEAPDLTTSLGAGVARDGMDFTREVDTSGLSLQDPAELERARAATVDYQPGDTTPQWDTQPGAAAPRTGLDMPAPEFDTGSLGIDNRTPSERMGLDPAKGSLTRIAALAVDTGASPVQFLGATGRDMQLRQTGPGVTNESNVIDVQGRVVEDRAIGTQHRLTAQESARESGATAFREGVPRSEIAAIPNVIHRAQQLRGYDDAAQKASSVPALPAPTNLREGLERIRAQKQEAANAQATAPEAAPTAQSVPAARTGAVEAAGVGNDFPTTPGATSEPQAPQAQQTSTQPAQAGAAPAADAAPGSTAAPAPAGTSTVRALTDGAPAENTGAQAGPAQGAQGEAQTAVARPDGWRKSMLRAAPVAKAMGIDPTGKRLAQVVAEIDARDTQTPATPAPAPQPGPVRLGRNNTPLSEGGKPFKTRKAAGDAKKLQPMMRVVTVPGGYALAEKTPAQLAAEERASRRLRNPNTSARGEPIPAHAFIAAAGGLNRVAASDMGVDGNPRIGNRTLFAGQGRGLSMDQATQMLIQDGYLIEGATINDALNLIKTGLTRPQYNADGIERIAQAESDAQFEDYLAAQEEAAADGDTDPFGMADEFTSEELDEVGYTSADPALQAEVSALIAQAEAMDIVDTFTILEDIARTYANATQDQYNAAARDALAQAIARGNQDGGSTAAQAAPAAEPATEQGLTQPDAPAALELAAQTPAEDAARQDAQEQATKAEAAAKRAEDAAAKAEDERKRIAQASVRAADRFELGQDPLDSLTGQGSIFDAPEQAAEDNYLDTLFGGDSESASAAQAAPSKRRIDAKKIVPALRQLADQKRAEADDWMGRVYRNNTTQIDLRGDGPSRQDSMSTNSVNESRRRRAVEALTQQANAASKLADRVENGTIDLQSRLDSISDTVDSDMRRDGGRPMIGASRADMFEGYISNNLLGDDNYGHGQGTVARMLRDAYEVAEQAPPEDLAEQAPQPITRADVTAAQQQAAAIITARIDAMTAGEVNTIARRFLPTMGVRPTVSKERNKAAVTDFTKVNPLAAADEFGATLPADVRRALQADMEGRVAADVFVEQGDAPMFSRTKAITPAQRAENFARWSDNATLITSAAAETHAFKTGEKIVVEAFHGTARPDRIGGVFDPKRATSGPMAYFTSSPELASNYAISKQDTSLADENQEYANWFKFKPAGARSAVSIDRAWLTLTPEQRRTIAGRMPDIRLDDDGNVIYEEDGGDPGSYDYELGRTRTSYDRQGNPLRAAVETWLNSGTLFGEELQFMKVLELAGFPVKDVTPDFPNDAFPGVYKVHVSMKNPLVVGDVPAEVRGALEAAAKADRSRAKPGADMWDKRSHTLRDWWAKFTDPDPSTATYAWTSIPDKVTDILKAHGYDGIVDWSGKGGGHQHPVYIPFASTQVKGAFNRGTYDPTKKDINFSRAPAISRPDSNARNVATQMLVDGLAEKWTRAPEIIVARNMQDPQVPQAVRDYDAELKSQGSDGEARGFIYKGKVYLLSDQLKGPQQIAEVLFHEVLGHYGLRGAFGESLTPILQQIGTMRRRDVVAKAREYGLFDKDALGGLDKATASDSQIWAAMSAKDRLSAAEEVLAELAQSRPEIGFVKRAVAAIRNWLRSNVPGFKSLALTDNDIIQAYILPARGFVTRSKETGAQSLERAMAAFSRTPGDQTQTDAFKRWFAGSRVVDADGKPMVVYHGTSADFSAFDPDTVGDNFGRDKEGFFFTGSSVEASGYADERSQFLAAGMPDSPPKTPREGANVMPVYLSLQNPLSLERYTWAIASTPETEIDEQGISLIDFFDGSNGDVVRYAQANGHDGVLLQRGGKTLAVAFRPEQIKSAIGNNGNFDPTNPDIRFSRTSTATGTQSAWDAPTPTGFDDVIYKLQDKNIDLKRVVEAITKSAGQVADSINAYLKEELFHKRAAKRVADFGARELKPLMNQMRLAGLSMEDVEEYLHARHAKEANAVIAQRNPGVPGLQDGGSGMTNAAADNYFAKLNPTQRRKLEGVAAKVDAIIADTRKLYVEYGLEDQATVDGWAGMFQHYIPLMREDKEGGMGTGQGFSVKGKETKGRTGSTRKVVDILANIASQREKLIVRGEKNIVAQALVGLAQANPNPDFWEVRSQAPTERVFDPKTGVVVDRPDPLFKSRENVAVAKVKDAKGNVTEQMVVFNEDNPRAVRMAAAMKNLDAGNLEGLLGVSAKITRYFAAINTQYNPVFGVVNLIRDVQGAMVNLAATPLAGQQGKIAKDTASALLGIYGDIRKTRKGGQATSQWSQLWEQMQDDGGTTGYRELFTTSADRANNLKSILNPQGWMDSKWGKVFTADGKLRVPMSMAQKGASEIFGWLSDYNEAMENGVRLAAYKAALDMKMSREQAASLAKNLTVNFNRKGQVGQQAGAVYAFFNAAMQGTARIGQTLFDMDGGDISTLRLSKTGKAVVYGGVTLGVMQALALAGAGFDEEDPPEFVRERSLIIPTGWTGIGPEKGYFSIPMPLGLHVIPGIGRHATEFALSGFDKPAKRALSVIGMFADAFNPIGNAGLSMQTLAPTALDPLVALTENKDWTGKPIARVSFNKALPGHTQWKDTATWYSKMAAEAINWVSGGNEYVAGALSPTPDQIDYLVAQVGGGVAREASKVFQAASTTVNGEELPTYKIPLLGRFAGNAASQASQGTAFYANLDKLNALETEIKGLRKDGRFDEAAKLVRENPQAIMIQMANRAERDVQRLRREKRELIAKDASREEVRAKEAQITAVMARLNEAAARRKATAPE